MRVTLIEKRPLLGGRASSYTAAATGERLDECQHGTMRCCTCLTRLLEQIGSADSIRYHDRLEFLDAQGVRSVITGSALPAPFHTLPSFLAFRSLKLTDKVVIARAMVAILRAKPGPALEAETAAAWFQRMGQTRRAVSRFWRPILISACNEELDRISCACAFKVFRDGFLLNARGFHFGVPSVPLASLYHEPALQYLKTRGACVHLRTIAGSFLVDEDAGRVTGLEMPGGEILVADHYVSALQFDLLVRALPASTVGDFSYFSALSGLEISPIMGVHLWFDRPIECPDALAVLDRETEWIFNKNRCFGTPAEPGQYLSIVVSASRRFAGLEKNAILETILREVRECLPDARQAKVLRSAVVRWPKATLSPLPGSDALRPDPDTPLTNFKLAGEWTNTGWPSTMEGAARSGYLAAEAVLRDAGASKRLLAPDMPPGRLAALIATRWS